jgi:hypothetical protein
MFQDEADEYVVEGAQGMRQIKDIRLLKMNIGKTRCLYFSQESFG